MHLLRKNIFHIFTVLLFAGLIVHSRQSPDTLGWMVLFLLVIFNAVLFILKKPISMISWFAIVIGILGTIMTMPALIKIGIEYISDNSGSEISETWAFEPAIYFMTTILFSLMQIVRLMR